MPILILYYADHTKRVSFVVNAAIIMALESTLIIFAVLNVLPKKMSLQVHLFFYFLTLFVLSYY